VAVMGGERNAGIEGEAELAGDQRIGHRPGVLGCVVTNQGPSCRIAEEHSPGSRPICSTSMP
jgi:hypothetical protein